MKKAARAKWPAKKQIEASRSNTAGPVIGFFVSGDEEGEADGKAAEEDDEKSEKVALASS